MQFKVMPRNSRKQDHHMLEECSSNIDLRERFELGMGRAEEIGMLDTGWVGSSSQVIVKFYQSLSIVHRKATRQL